MAPHFERGARWVVLAALLSGTSWAQQPAPLPPVVVPVPFAQCSGPLLFATATGAVSFSVDAGSLIVVAVSIALPLPSTVTHITDGFGNTYTQAVSLRGAAPWNMTSQIWFTTSGDAGTSILSTGLLSLVNPAPQVIICEYPGWGQAGVDGLAFTTGTGLSLDAGALTLDGGVQLLFAYAAAQNGVSAPPTDFYGWQDAGSTVMAADLVATDGGTFIADFLGSASGGTSTPGPWNAMLVAFLVPPDAGLPDAGLPDGGWDGGVLDAGSDDAGTVDAGRDGGIDSGVVDAGSDSGVDLDSGTDSGVADSGTGTLDSGPTDSGTPDSGSADAGQPDAGPPDQTADAGEWAPNVQLGCGCQTSPDALFLALVAVAVRKRRPLKLS